MDFHSNFQSFRRMGGLTHLDGLSEFAGLLEAGLDGRLDVGATESGHFA